MSSHVAKDGAKPSENLSATKETNANTVWSRFSRCAALSGLSPLAAVFSFEFLRKMVQWIRPPSFHPFASVNDVFASKEAPCCGVFHFAYRYIYMIYFMLWYVCHLYVCSRLPDTCIHARLLARMLARAWSCAFVISCFRIHGVHAHVHGINAHFSVLKTHACTHMQWLWL